VVCLVCLVKQDQLDEQNKPDNQINRAHDEYEE